MRLVLLCIITIMTLVGCSDKRLSAVSSDTEVLSRSGMSSEEIEMFHATNSERLTQGLSPLMANSTCVRMAQEHAFDMVRRGYFSHDSPTETFSQRTERYGLAGNWVGENIARGFEDTGSILSMWMSSSGHRSNILNANYRSLGVGKFQDYWVQCFSGLQGDN